MNHKNRLGTVQLMMINKTVQMCSFLWYVYEYAYLHIHNVIYDTTDTLSYFTEVDTIEMGIFMGKTGRVFHRVYSETTRNIDNEWELLLSFYI